MKTVPISTYKLSQLWARLRKPTITMFIVFYIYCGALFLSPPTEWRQTLLSPFWNFIEYVGLWQYYTVFVPPRIFNLYLEGNVKLENGELLVWKYPRMEQLGLIEKMQKERYRKLYNDIANNASDGVLWPDLARYIARKVYVQHGKRPIEVTLVRYWSDIPPASGDPLPRLSNKYDSLGFFTYPIRIEDLQ
jgi:hypothetical protein